MNQELVLFILDVPPELEESLVDFLLEYDSEIEFSTFPIYGHRRSHWVIRCRKRLPAAKYNKACARPDPYRYRRFKSQSIFFSVGAAFSRELEARKSPAVASCTEF